MPLSAKISLISACFFWAISFVATKVALDSAPPLTVVMLRLLISSLCFVLWLALCKKPLRFGGWIWLRNLFVLSLLGTGLHYGAQTIGIKYTTASNASLYAVTAPISITIIAAFFLKERITLKKTLGICIALAGVLVVMGLETIVSLELKSHIVGDFLVFTSIFMWALFTVFGKKVTETMDAIELTALVTFLGAAYMIPVSILEMYFKSFSLLSVSLKAWLSIFFLGITCSFLATLLYFYALEKADSQKVGVYLYTIPPMTYIFASFLLGEAIGYNLILGSILVFMGVYLTEKG